MAWPRAITLALFTLLACNSEPDTTTSSTQDASTAIATTGSTSDTTTTTGTTAEPTTTGSQTTAPDGCASHPAGDWAACQKGGLTDKTLCGFDEASSVGTVTCLSPSSGSFNVCGIRDCVDNCDCFAAPTSGDAIPACEMVGGSKACVLYCLNGQQCPDGMECVGGYCYWPD